jgi:hypothetical protein
MKLLLKLAIALVLLLLLAFGVGVWMLDSGVKAAVERGGTYALGTETTLESADLSLLSGELAMEGLSIANPPGFSAAPFFAMGLADAQVDLATLGKDTIVVPRIVLADIALSVERTKAGTNYGVLLANLERLAPKEPGPEEPSEPSGEAKKFVIQHLELRDISVSADLLPEVGQLTKTSLNIPSILLEDVGTAEGGVPVSELISRVIRALLATTVQLGEGQLPAELLNDLRGQLEALGTDLEGQARDVIDQTLEGLGVEKRQLPEGVQDALDDADQELEKLFGKKKDDGKD